MHDDDSLNLDTHQLEERQKLIRLIEAGMHRD